MKKIPTLFEREFADHKVVGIKPVVTPGMEWVLEGAGVATVKYDGSCCAIIDGKFYKRYDAKKGKKPPVGAIPCQPEADPVTGHWPHWVLCNTNDPADQWYCAAYERALKESSLPDATYEAIGPHFQRNPYDLDEDTLIVHGSVELDDFPRDFDGMRTYLEQHEIEGVVFWKDGEPKCKIKRSDFGFKWPV